MQQVPTHPIGRLLVANRGEIALRIMRACRELNIATVAVFGSGEEQALHVRYADDAYRLPAGGALPYLAMDALIDIARRAGVDAIHPGYGFLAENAEFAASVTDAGLVFVGPPADAIAAMGDKVEARRVATSVGVSPVPGTSKPVGTMEEASAWADRVGYPVAVKASGGGGGRGFRVARTSGEIRSAFEGSRREAERYFSNPEVYLEKYLEHPRHIEIQVFADHQAKVIAFPERDCSIQRRHQKLIEESPSPAVDPQLRAELKDAAERLTSGVGYVGAGTIEFLLDADNTFYFLEMNTRIQVEHTVTEMVTGIDLVREQLLVAQGHPLSFDRRDVQSRGWALECRINAEDAGRSFAPVSGMLGKYREPSGFGVRVDAAFAAGDEVSARYDSMIAKVVTWGRDRREAISRMERALGDYVIGGLPTTIPFHRNVLASEAFRTGNATTTFLQDHPELIPDPQPAALHAEPGDQVNEHHPLEMTVEVDGRRFHTVVSGLPSVAVSPGRGPQSRRTNRRRSSLAATGGTSLLSPLQGTVVSVAVAEGDTVDAGDPICAVEAMKMENEIIAQRAGIVTDLAVKAGGTIGIGGVVARIIDA